MRRQDRLLPEAEARDLITRAYCGRVGTVNADGSPYVVPLLHVFSGDVISMHNTSVRGQFRLNVERDARGCFEVDEPVKVFDYGRFECDSGLAYRSAIAYGRIQVIEERAAKMRFFDELLAKYGTGVPGRPKSFYPRLDQVTVYALAVERITGKHCPLPAVSEQWPAVDRTKTPDAKP
ncbi:MAG TPA: pyridoxamine 5'-phosphate oxidase family protein [Burkholderiales bacterium]|jgi:nitroimidazol reductase NimA-like FMN-containing flavoprotein (pyridoxamine 5'-phosphate oxidase superfamily)|nr:pyridoxamine 5'-phosphate oxidase family protein [Burkholderiales bacterium]